MGQACLGGLCRAPCAPDEVYSGGACVKAGQRLATGNFHACALHDGGVACWGAGSTGALGSGPYDGGRGPRFVTSLGAPVSVVAGDTFTCALVADGGVRCWGNNSFGQLGDNGSSESFVPVVAAFSGTATHLQAGANHVCAREAGGTVACWGANFAGQVGTGSTAMSSYRVPSAALLPGPTARVFAGDDGSFALLADGGLLRWGDDFLGIPAATPSPLAWLDGGATSMSLSFNHGCALRFDGLVECWGRGSEGQLGRTVATMAAQQPAVVPALGLARSVCAGQGFTCVVRDDAGAACFGDNTFGQLGRGNYLGGSTPAEVVDLPPVVDVACHYRTACARTATGAVWCWGDNALGQLGAPSPPTATRPLEVALP